IKEGESSATSSKPCKSGGGFHSYNCEEAYIDWMTTKGFLSPFPQDGGEDLVLQDTFAQETAVLDEDPN
ncbi:hypothetical protein MKW92_053876, partial [Papaver armeniacum]